MKGARFRLAGGYGGLLAAINEVLACLDTQITFASFFTAFLTCVIAFRSLFAGVFFLLPAILVQWQPRFVFGAAPGARADGRQWRLRVVRAGASSLLHHPVFAIAAGIPLAPDVRRRHAARP